MSAQIREITPRFFKPKTTIVLFAGRGHGKTSIIKWIMYYWQNKIRLPIVLSETAEVNHDYDDIVPMSCVHKNFSEDLITRILAYNYGLKQLSETKPYRKKVMQTLLVLDDVDNDKKFKNSSAVKSLFYNGRHSNMTLIITAHDPMSLGSHNRGNIDYIILRNLRTKKDHEKFYANYLTVDRNKI